MRTCLKWVALVVMVFTMASTVSAQDLYGQVGPAAEQVMNEGLDGSPDTITRIIEIFNAYGIDLDVSPWEARDIVDRQRFDRERIGRIGLVTIAFQRAADSCADLRAKAAAAARLGRGLMFASQLNAIGMGISLATGAGAPFAVPFGFASTVTGFASAWAGQVSSAYTAAANAQGCGLIHYEEEPWNSTSPIAPFRMPVAWRGRSGLAS